jgi:Holliday junction resolvase RusA-like endonuclease
MHRINIKPMSVNEAWQGKRYKTKKYKDYCSKLYLLLPKLETPHGKIEVHFIFGITSVCDVDNPLKPLIDILQKKYSFNDKNIMKIIVEKKHVKTGQEYFEFKIISYL